MTAKDFLKERGLIKEGFNEFIISGDFGKISLNDLLDEYAKNRISDIEDWLGEVEGISIPDRLTQ